MNPIGSRNDQGRRRGEQSACESMLSRESQKSGLHNTKSVLGLSQAPVTTAEYGTLQDAYDYFNKALFGGSLPQVLITLQRHGRARGYFSPKRFQRRDEVRENVHEVALNPDSFTGRTDEEILSTLTHEMAHVWQQEHGHPGRGRYHNRQWAAKMHSIGLMPSTTGKPGGAVTGDSVSHYIIEDGPFLAACGRFLHSYRLVWESAMGRSNGSALRTVNTQTRAKFTCPNCGLNVWAKPDALVDCHACSQEAREPVLMRGNGDTQSAAQMPKLGSKKVFVQLREW